MLERAADKVRARASRFGGHLALAVVLAVAVVGYAANGLAGNIDPVGQLDPFPGQHMYGDVWGEGNYAYLGSFAGTGVAIIDISTPAAPFLAAHYDPAGIGAVFDVKVNGGIGYFASSAGDGLHVVDLSNPAAPVLISKITVADGGYGDIHNVAFGAGHIYEADNHTPAVPVFDVRTPATPLFVRRIITPASIHDVTVINNRLYASSFSAGFTYIYDVSSIDTADATLLSAVPTGANTHSNWVTSDGSLLISAREDLCAEIRIYDISDPLQPVLLASIDAESLGLPGFSPHNPVLFNDDLLFVSWYENGVVALDIRDPTDPILAGNFDTFPETDRAPRCPGPTVIGVGAGNWGVFPLLGLDRVLLSDMEGGLFVVDATGVLDQCGNGVRGTREQCDDGNLVDGDGCSSACQLELCQPVPAAGCRRPTATQRAVLVLKDDQGISDARDKLSWRWSRGAATSTAELGDPLTMTSYALCVYDRSGPTGPQLLMNLAAPAGGDCAGVPCWRASGQRGFRYRDRGGRPNGLTSLRLKAGTDGKAKMVVKGRGRPLGMPALPLVPPVTVQLTATNGECWEAVYSTPAINKASLFKAKSD